MAIEETDRSSSKKLAGLIGPTLVALSVSEGLNLHIWAINIAPVTYLNGTILFVSGLAIVRAHNRWRGWPLLVTLVGWLAMLGGLYRMVAPEAKQASENRGTYVMIGFLFLVGVFLTYKAYGKSAGNPDASENTDAPHGTGSPKPPA